MTPTKQSGSSSRTKSVLWQVFEQHSWGSSDTVFGFLRSSVINTSKNVINAPVCFTLAAAALQIGRRYKIIHHINNVYRDMIVFSVSLDGTCAEYTWLNRGFAEILIWFTLCLHGLECVCLRALSVYTIICIGPPHPPTPTLCIHNSPHWFLAGLFVTHLLKSN